MTFYRHHWVLGDTSDTVYCDACLVDFASTTPDHKCPRTFLTTDTERITLES